MSNCFRVVMEIPCRPIVQKSAKSWYWNVKFLLRFFLLFLKWYSKTRKKSRFFWIFKKNIKRILELWSIRNFTASAVYTLIDWLIDCGIDNPAPDKCMYIVAMCFQVPPCRHDDIYSYIKELIVKNSSTGNETCEFGSRDKASGRHRGMKSDLA